MDESERIGRGAVIADLYALSANGGARSPSATTAT